VLAFRPASKPRISGLESASADGMGSQDKFHSNLFSRGDKKIRGFDHAVHRIETPDYLTRNRSNRPCATLLLSAKWQMPTAVLYATRAADLSAAC